MKFIKLTVKLTESEPSEPIWFNISNIASIEKRGDRIVILSNVKSWNYFVVEETIDEILEAIHREGETTK